VAKNLLMFESAMFWRSRVTSRHTQFACTCASQEISLTSIGCGT